MVFVDGLELGDAEGLVLRDRQRLAGDGILIAVVTVGVQSGDMLAAPELEARGFLHDDERLGRHARRGPRRWWPSLHELGEEHVTGQKLHP